MQERAAETAPDLSFQNSRRRHAGPGNAQAASAPPPWLQPEPQRTPQRPEPQAAPYTPSEPARCLCVTAVSPCSGHAHRGSTARAVTGHSLRPHSLRSWTSGLPRHHKAFKGQPTHHRTLRPTSSQSTNSRSQPTNLSSGRPAAQPQRQGRPPGSTRCCRVLGTGSLGEAVLRHLRGHASEVACSTSWCAHSEQLA